MKNEEVNICFVTDNNYVQHTLVALGSMLAHKFPSSQYHVFVICDKVDSERQNMMLSLNQPGFAVSMVEYDNNTYQKKDYELGKYISAATYIRLKLPSIFRNLNRILYLDGDIIVQDDISRFYNVDLCGKAIAGVPDCGICVESISWDMVNYVRETLPNHKTEYFNAGVILMDLDRLRKIGFEKNCETLYKARTDFIFADQDILNFATQGEKRIVPICWNCPVFSFLLNYASLSDEIFREKMKEIYNVDYKDSLMELVYKASIIHLNGSKLHIFDTTYLGSLYERYLKLALEYVKDG